MDICCSNDYHHTCKDDYCFTKFYIVILTLHVLYIHPSTCPSIKINLVLLVLVLRSISISKYKMAKQLENGTKQKPASKEMQVAK